MTDVIYKRAVAEPSRNIAMAAIIILGFVICIATALILTLWDG
ncbi:hypothetical protein ACSBM8_11015 [Sphingomonas sp. ASY06-1R]